MSRDWLAAYCRILGQPKYRRLSIPARAGLFHVWLLAGAQTPEATWPSRDALADALDLDGYPLDVLDDLIARQWLDVDGTGRVVVHDWDDWQLAATRAARIEYERDRKRDWRRRNRVDAAAPPSPAPLSPDKTETPQHTTTQVSPIVRDTSGTESGPDLPEPAPSDPFDAPELPVLAWLARHGCDIRPGNGYHQKAVLAVERHGVDAFLETLERLATAGYRHGDVKGFLFDAIDTLDRQTRPKPTELAKAEHEDAERRAFQRRLDATQRNLADLRGDPQIPAGAA